MAYATPDDVAARLGRPLDASEAQIVQVRLGDAERIIKKRIPDLANKISSGGIDQGDLVMVESEMLLRLIRNLDGFEEESDQGYSYRLREAVASGRLSVLNNEWALLGIRRGAFTIRPYLEMPW